MKACKDIDFLDSYWKEAKRIAEDVKSNLSMMRETGAKKNTLYFVKFSEIKDRWSVADLLQDIYGKSEKLKVLGDKIEHMILKGRGDSVKPMVEAICNNNIKKLKQPNIGSIGYGHFRWNYKAYTLNEAEIKHLKKYFKL